MAAKGLATGTLSLMLGYSNALDLKPSTGSVSMTVTTHSYQTIIPYVMELYERIALWDCPIRRLSLSCNGVSGEECRQYDLFTDYAVEERDRKLQQATLEIKRRFGKDALVRGMDLQEAATTRERNRQIGGHKSGK